ncbi:MAG: GNAT family N-acetyltransferase [Promethearchaeota archaeon]
MNGQDNQNAYKPIKLKDKNLFKTGGHDRKLLNYEWVNLGRIIQVRELNLESEYVLRLIMGTIKREQIKNTIMASTRWNENKKPTRWFYLLYPMPLSPRFLGAFFQDGTFLGWISLIKSFVLKNHISIGCIIEPFYRDAGLGSALIFHVKRYLKVLYPDNDFSIMFTTKNTNIHVIKIAQKLGLPKVMEIDRGEYKELLFAENLSEPILMMAKKKSES